MTVKQKTRRTANRAWLLRLDVLCDLLEGRIIFTWKDPVRATEIARLYVTCFPQGMAFLLTGPAELADAEVQIVDFSTSEICETVNAYLDRVDRATWGQILLKRPAQEPGGSRASSKKAVVEELDGGDSPGSLVLAELSSMMEAFRLAFSGQPDPNEFFANSLERKLAIREAQHRRKIEVRLAAERRAEMERMALAARRVKEPALPPHAAPEPPSPPKVSTKISPAKTASATPPPPPPSVEVPVRIEEPGLSFLGQRSAEAEVLRDFLQIETAALWWVSNQSDDLLCLPWCNIQRLEYQIRTALRAIGPLRGRALLSDEVGLGKTVEAGLILKELLFRGMVGRFLILTVPSFVDQWQEELEAKFGLQTATTNQPVFKADPEKFWAGERAVIASLHTFKGDRHRALATAQPWDMLIVDEAHYLRNATSQAWKAVNATPRKFLLLLSATPVQNSLEELYHLVTLLLPGQLPPPQEFRRRFIDPKRPHQPKEPEELRRLLGQVMIRNTRANAGIDLPPRRAETVLFEPSADEASFWREWEADLRRSLDHLPASQAQMWGRLLLQAAGSSPMAWESALEKFPDAASAARWKGSAPLRQSWARKMALLAPLAKTAPHLVVFSQFLATQAALAEGFRAAGLPTVVLNGQTPAAERQTLADRFRKEGGVLLLTQSGSEGRNLQFCHRLVNVDLPWNPMEIEQRIGRLHRIGQEKPVEIYNLVQANTLQAHLLEILQDKLNLFELVVGESGLILGDRFSSDDFAEEVFRRWRESSGDVEGAFRALGQELEQARAHYNQIRELDETLFSDEYEAG
jgi:SNF2 family DNA or RNA helicase